jgi:hypothetical protein
MRRLFLIFPVIFLITLNVFPQAGITIDCPGSWGPGRYSKVIVSISFVNDDGFARFTQDFPVGFRIVKDKITDGDFSWNGSQLNVVWMSIPGSKRVRFSYFVKPDNQMQGDIELGGKVVTITGGTSRETTEVIERQITIGGTGGLLPAEMNKEINRQIVTNVTNAGVTSKIEQAPGAVTVIFRVQVATSSKEISVDAMKQKLGIDQKDKMIVIKSGEIFKYQMGEFRDKASALKVQKLLVSKGISDAFVVRTN